MCCCRKPGHGCCSWLFCCFPVRGCTYFFVFISFLLQLAMCTFFLVYEEWYVFTGVAAVLIAHLYFIFVARGQRFCLLHLFTAYSSIWSLIYLGLFVWSIVLEIWPDLGYNPFWYFYYYIQGEYMYDMAREDVQALMWIMMGLSFGSLIIQGYTSRVLWAYKKWLELQAVKARLHRHHSSHHSPHVTVITNTPVYTISPPPPAPYQPPPPPPPSAYQYHGPTPSNAAMVPPQQQPVQVLPSAPPVSPRPTPDPPRRVYPEVAPIHFPTDVPSSSSAHPDAPPPYAAAVDEEKGGAYENVGYQQKY